MNKISCCRVCLADNVKTHSLIDSPFQELYEILTNTKVHQQEGKSTAVCYLCHAVLLQCYKFQQTALRSEALLAQLYLDGIAVTDSKLSLFSRPILHSYVTTTVEQINIYNERDRYAYSGKLERDGECFDNCVKEENGDDHDTTNTQTIDSYESRQTSTSAEASLVPRQDSYDTRQRTKLYLEIDGLKKSIMQDFQLKVNSKETDLQELTSDSELMSSNRNLENYTSLNNTLNSTRNIGEFDSTKNMPCKNTSFNQNVDWKQYKSQIALQNFKSNEKFDYFESHNLDSNKMCNRNTKYIHYSQNLKLDNNTIYDTQEYIAKKVNSRLLKMVYDSPTDQNVNTSNASQNPNVTYNVSENQNLKYNISQNPNLSYEISENLNLTSKASSMDNDESRLTDTQPYESDSEDDLPLKVLRKRGKKLKDEEQVSKREYRKASNLGSSVLHISKPDQLAALTARASSHNYLHATYKCEYCYRGFLTKEVYSKHMEKHDEARGPYACPVCWLRYRSPRLLAAHARAAHERRYQCTACHHVSTTKNQAIDHQRIHNGDLFECKMCSKSFHARTTYLSHMRARHPTATPSAVCSICGDRFVSAQGLAMHRAKMHANDGAGESSLAAARGFVCVSCGERFEDQQELNEHRNDKHRDGMEEDSARATTKYCSTCDIHFASRRAYARHMLSTPAHMQLAVHTKECPICLQTIMGTVRSHMRIHDKETRPRTTKPTHEAKLLHCDQCSQSFATKSRLNAHVRRVHLGLKYNKNLVCEVCGNKCTSAARLRYHQRTHTGERPYPCLSPGCGARLADSNQLRIHTRTHTGERPYTCHTCGASFAQKPALNRHNRVHTGVKPHTCDICNKSFTQSNSLNTHIRSVHLKMPRKLYSKTTYVRKTSQNAVEPKKNGDLAVSVSGQLTSNVTIVQSSEISDVTLVDSQVQSKLSLGHQ